MGFAAGLPCTSVLGVRGSVLRVSSSSFHHEPPFGCSVIDSVIFLPLSDLTFLVLLDAGIFYVRVHLYLFLVLFCDKLRFPHNRRAAGFVQLSLTSDIYVHYCFPLAPLGLKFSPLRGFMHCTVSGHTASSARVN